MLLRALPLLLLTFLTSFDSHAVSQTTAGTVFDEMELESALLGGPRKYAIYLPPDYAQSRRSYPVLYLLHGAGDDQTGWVQFGEVLRITDQATQEGTSTAMIIVMPDADTGQRGYFNDIHGKWGYEDFFFDELIPEIEKKYRVKTDKRYRAVAGLSMGGGGAFMYALHRPEMFSSACPLSASTGPLTLDDATRRYGSRSTDDDTDSLPSDELIESYYKRHSALELVKSMPDDQKRDVRWYIDCGDDDFLYEGNSLVHIEMKKRGIVHEYRVRDGEHNWTYWREALPEVLRFVSEAFHQK